MGNIRKLSAEDMKAIANWGKYLGETASDPDMKRWLSLLDSIESKPCEPTANDHKFLKVLRIKWEE